MGEPRFFMDRALLVRRLHFAFTITFHYLFPQRTMGLAPLIVGLESPGLRRNDETLHQFGTFLGESLQH
jgi:cytochrome d ubiquinol oxidase subunit I